MNDETYKPDSPDELPGVLRAAVDRLKQRPIPQAAMQRALDRAARCASPIRWTERRLIQRAALGFAAAVAACIALSLWLAQPSDLWANVVKAVQARPWIHARLQDAAPGQSREFWTSTSRAVGGSRSGEEISFFDDRLRISYHYKPQEKVLYRLPASAQDLGQGEQFLAMFQGLFRGDSELKAGLPGMVLKDQKRIQTEKDGRKWDQYELHFQIPSHPDVDMHMTFLVDAQTRLPRSMTMTGRPGQSLEWNFDYPENGPADIYALGVPKDAKLIDRVPTGDMPRMLAAMQAGRDRFDDFHAIVVRSSSPDSFGGPGQEIPMLFLVWKKGNRWRVEIGVGVGEFLRAGFSPNKDNKEVVREACKATFFDSIEVSDGKVVYEGSLGENRGSFKSVGTADQGSWRFRGALEAMPANWCYPESFPPPNDRTEETVDLKPTDGPPNTIMVTSHLLQARENEIPYQRFWLDPARDYAVVRYDILNADPANKVPTTQVSQHLMDQWEQTPGGIWYPTRAGQGSLWKERKPDSRGVMPYVEWYHFFLDFQAEMPDDLFKPARRTVLTDRYPVAS
jgi:hypothetical protein